MPNVGRPSRDCHLCRQRRVKCDLTQPECNRCTRLGRKCPGYRDATDLLFRVEDQASFASSSARDKRKKRAEKSTPSDDGRSQKQSASQSPPKEAEAIKPPAAKIATATTSSTTATDEAWDLLVHESTESIDTEFDPFKPLSQLDKCILKSWHHSIALDIPEEPIDRSSFPYFLHHFYAPVNPRRAFGFLGFLPGMIELAPEDSALSLTCRAIAQAFFANVNSTPGTRSQRAEIYGRALKATQAAIIHPQSCKQDETLMSVWLLSLYELIVGDPDSTDRSGLVVWTVHTSGLVSLLKSRGSAQFESLVGRGVFWVVYNTIQIRCLVGGMPCPAESLEWFASLEPYVSPKENYHYQVARYGYFASIICSNVRKYVDKSPGHSLSADEIFADAVALESRSFPLMELPFAIEDLTLGHSTLPEVDLQRVTLRTYLCSYRLRLNLSLLQLLTNNPWPSPPANPQPQIQAVVTTIQSLSDIILAAVPHLFPPNTTPPVPTSANSQRETSRPVFWTDGLRMLWPLRLVAFWKPSRDDQKIAAFAALKRIGDEMCIRQGIDEFIPTSNKVVGPLQMVVKPYRHAF